MRKEEEICNKKKGKGPGGKRWADGHSRRKKRTPQKEQKSKLSGETRTMAHHKVHMQKERSSCVGVRYSRWGKRRW